MLQIKEIQKHYNRIPVLRNIKFDIHSGSVTGIIGPNGAGKSTLLKIITGFEKADTGEITYQNRKFTSQKQKVSIFSYMPEHLDIYPDFYVKEYILFIEGTAGCCNPKLIDTLKLNDVRYKKIKNLSKGYRQRLKLFTALTNSKPIAVLDEPFDGFDPIQLREILSMIKSEKDNGRTFILSIHQMSDAEKICDNFILLNEGRIIADGTLEELSIQFETETKSLEEIFIKALQ